MVFEASECHSSAGRASPPPLHFCPLQGRPPLCSSPSTLSSPLHFDPSTSSCLQRFSLETRSSSDFARPTFVHPPPGCCSENLTNLTLKTKPPGTDLEDCVIGGCVGSWGCDPGRTSWLVESHPGAHALTSSPSPGPTS